MALRSTTSPNSFPYQEHVREGIDKITSMLSDYNLQIALEDQVKNILDPGQVMSLAAGLFTGLGEAVGQLVPDLHHGDLPVA
ncbi:MAG: hypothetical protein R2724_26405 [Bryobacterales bacterium]